MIEIPDIVHEQSDTPNDIITVKIWFVVSFFIPFV